MRVLLRVAALAILLVTAAPRPAAADTSLATWYGPGFEGGVMANGQVFTMHDPTTAASNLFPLGSWLAVRNLQNGNEVIVQVKDRGAFRHAVDLSMAAFSLLDDLSLGVVPVDVRPTAPPLPGVRPTPPPGSFMVTIQAGDSLSNLARRYGVPVETLVALNALPSPHYIQAGTALVIPPGPTAPAMPAVASSAPASAPGPAAGQAAEATASASQLDSQPPTPSPAVASSTVVSPTIPTAVVVPQATAIGGVPNGVAGNQAPGFAAVVEVNGETVARVNRRPVAAIADPPGVDFAYVRQAPAADSALVAAVPRGARLDVLDLVGGQSVTGGEDRWWRVRYNGTSGYVWYPLIRFE